MYMFVNSCHATTSTTWLLRQSLSEPQDERDERDECDQRAQRAQLEQRHSAAEQSDHHNSSYASSFIVYCQHSGEESQQHAFDANVCYPCFGFCSFDFI